MTAKSAAKAIAARVTSPQRENLPMSDQASLDHPMFVIFINSHDRTIQKRELPGWPSSDHRWHEVVELLGADYIGSAHKFVNGDNLWVDDAAEMKPAQSAFGFDISEPRPGWPFEGKGVIVGRNVSSALTTIEGVRPHIRWFTIEECYVERCRMRGVVPKPPLEVIRLKFRDAAPKQTDLVPVLKSFAAHARTDVHAERWFDEKDKRWGYRPIKEPLTPDHLRKHLARLIHA